MQREEEPREHPRALIPAEKHVIAVFTMQRLSSLSLSLSLFLPLPPRN